MGRAPARRPILGVLVSITVLASACAQTPPERSSLPEVGEVLDPPAQCAFLLGEPQGVLITDVAADSAAEGILLEGDVITAIEGQPTTDADTLIEVMTGTAPGDVVRVDYNRDDAEGSATLTLGANPEDPDRAVIGVMITTQYQAVAAGEATGPVEPSLSARPISIGDSIYLHDPIPITWEKTDITVDSGVEWYSTTSGIYSMEAGVMSDHLAEEEVEPGPFQQWDLVRAVGSIGPDLIVVVTQPVPGDPGRVTVGISRFDPVELEAIWAEPLISGFGIPIQAYGSPDQERVVLTGISEDGSEITGVQIWDGDGFDTGLDDLTSLGTPLGWLDEGSVLFRSDDVVATRLQVGDGESEQLMIDTRLSDLPIFPVGDGHSVLAIDGRSLILDDLEGEGEARTLARDCSIVRVGEPGWGT
jgi:hypothetical protein